MLNADNNSTKHCRIDSRSIHKAIRTQKVSRKRVVLADTECKGLRLVINVNSASWTYAYRRRGLDAGGKRFPQRTLKLGDLALLAPPEARYMAGQMKASVRQGGDPALEIRRENAARQIAAARRKDLGKLAEQYILAYLNKDTIHHKNEAAHTRMSLRELSLTALEPSEVTAKDLRRLLEMHQSRPATARHRFGAFSRFLDYLVDEEVLAVNPSKSVSRKHKPKPPPPRERFYSVEEIARIWHGSESLKPVYRDYLRFLIILPLRAGEAANLSWPQIEFHREELHLSAEDTKAGQAFIMPLPLLALDILRSREIAAQDRVFQLSSIRGASMKAQSYFSRKARQATGIDGFALHNLRRTFSSLMAEHSNFDAHLIDSLLNRKQSSTVTGVMRHYQHAKRLEKRREVMALWNNLITGWIS